MQYHLSAARLGWRRALDRAFRALDREGMVLPDDLPSIRVLRCFRVWVLLNLHDIPLFWPVCRLALVGFDFPFSICWQVGATAATFYLA
jgi:hypothetical protein